MKDYKLTKEQERHVKKLVNRYIKMRRRRIVSKVLRRVTFKQVINKT